jgi:hypothetical protein
MTLDQFTTWYGEEYGRAGLEELPPRLERVNQTGVSRAWRGSTVDNLIRCNRAGARGNLSDQGADHRPLHPGESASGGYE